MCRVYYRERDWPNLENLFGVGSMARQMWKLQNTLVCSSLDNSHGCFTSHILNGNSFNHSRPNTYKSITCLHGYRFILGWTSILWIREYPRGGLELTQIISLSSLCCTTSCFTCAANYGYLESPWWRKRIWTRLWLYKLQSKHVELCWQHRAN